MTTLTNSKWSTWNGAPLLPAEPFRAWLTAAVSELESTATPNRQARRGGVGVQLVAARVGCGHKAVRQWLDATNISELTVERAGIAIAEAPRLAAELYPRLAEPVCALCGADEDCEHLGGPHV